jgi:hypothetical protein
MTRTLIVCALLTAVLPAARADDKAPAQTVVRLKVRPMAAPRPALRYQLLPELKEMSPGNPIQAYLRCFFEQHNFFRGKAGVEEREKYLAMPLADLPVKEVRDYGGHALRQADYAARLDTPDWQTLPRIRLEGVEMLLPEMHSLRILAGALKVRFRFEVAAGRFDDAVRTAKTAFALARTLGEHPTMIGNLVGIAVAIQLAESLDEMVAQPGCPNLYWALTDLPRPLVGLRKGLQGERVFFQKEMAMFDAATPLDEAGLARAVERIRQLRKGMAAPSDPKDDLRGWLDERAKDEARVMAARRRLAEAGLDPKQLKKLPALQVILLDEKRAYEEGRDEVSRWMSLPYWEAEAHLRPAAGDGRDVGLFGNGVAVAAGKVRRAQLRVEQRLALLRHVEALRLYAAANKGELPASLSGVGVPLPVDPFTGKPFIYKVEGKKAILQGTPPRGTPEAGQPGYNVRFEVTIGG